MLGFETLADRADGSRRGVRVVVGGFGVVAAALARKEMGAGHGDWEKGGEGRGGEQLVGRGEQGTGEAEMEVEGR